MSTDPPPGADPLESVEVRDDAALFDALAAGRTPDGDTTVAALARLRGSLDAVAAARPAPTPIDLGTGPRTLPRRLALVVAGGLGLALSVGGVAAAVGGVGPLAGPFAGLHRALIGSPAHAPDRSEQAVARINALLGKVQQQVVAARQAGGISSADRVELSRQLADAAAALPLVSVSDQRAALAARLTGLQQALAQLPGLPTPESPAARPSPTPTRSGSDRGETTTTGGTATAEPSAPAETGATGGADRTTEAPKPSPTSSSPPDAGDTPAAGDGAGG
ncbi:MAG TPA: hypothetical protein VNG13_15240 [Mycobacteriales bacterium]|nr:hypothetical protein [Mycobacteriales bacterium]